ncbi:hypothetical protein [Gordonia alkanivorans]|uniref:phage terminase small subunit n=1 Tax=Gordonia alkanivorans TaxID=84096 RepID=UPI0024B6C1E0|nr:hypothetical protein [Gordonia alkanivorans]MDJ0010109.1 hypothetical protein [Gordonia alkanivorans]MDJ0495701.1 hypothetical protein [Gordonia alkanivorans]
MAGRGPAPKDPSKRARRNADPVALRVIEAKPETQPELPELMPNGEPWPARTHEWWRMWADSPLAEDFTANDWSELLDAAVLHGEYWSGNVKVAAELRLRVSKFGATPEDRARLRIQFAQADEADEKRRKPVSSARDRRGPLTG